MTEALLLASASTILRRLPLRYWGALDRDRVYPAQFVREWTAAGLLNVLMPAAYGGAGLSTATAASLLREVNRSGGNSACVHAFYYLSRLMCRATSDVQRAEWLPRFTAADWTLQAMGVTEAVSGSDALSLRTYARPLDSDTRYTLHGEKMWTSRAAYSSHMLVLARTEPFSGHRSKDNLALYLVDLVQEQKRGTTVVAPIETAINHSTTAVRFDGAHAERLGAPPASHWAHLMTALNVERALIAAECLGDCEFFLERATQYARDRHVFGQPLATNQGISFPLARGFVQFKAAEAMTANALADDGASRSLASMAKLLASEASWALAETAMMVHGGNAFATGDLERKWRETRLFQTAPLSTNLILQGIAKTELGL